MEKLDDKASALRLVREAAEQNLKLEAMSLITTSCTSKDVVDWGDIRRQLEQLIGSGDQTTNSSNHMPVIV